MNIDGSEFLGEFFPFTHEENNGKIVPLTYRINRFAELVPRVIIKKCNTNLLNIRKKEVKERKKRKRKEDNEEKEEDKRIEVLVEKENDFLKSQKTPVVKLTPEDEYPAVVITNWVGSTGSGCLESDMDKFKDKFKLYDVCMKNILPKNVKKYNNSVSKYFKIECKLCKKEISTYHFDDCVKINDIRSSKSKVAKLFALGQFWDSKD